jgi:hypothetical protein
MYILCLYKKDRLRGDFGILQSGSKGIISEIGIVDWRRVYVYILSMGRGGVRVKNTYSFFRAANGASMDRNYRGSIPPTIRTQPAIGSISTRRSEKMDPRGSFCPDDERRPYGRLLISWYWGFRSRSLLVRIDHIIQSH